jgi:hypothetical protein
MLQQEFEKWLEEVKQVAVEDFGYSQNEVNNLNHKHWNEYYNLGLSPFEAIIQHLTIVFNHQNKL